MSARIGAVVGLAAEARLLRALPWHVAIGGGGTEGAARAAAALVASGATVLVSFGLAGGLDPALEAGALLVPGAVQIDGRDLPTDAALTAALGGPTPGRLLCARAIVATAMEKQRLRAATGCVALDLETGAVADRAGAAGLSFAVLRAVCDPAARDLPPAALVALGAGGAIGMGRVLASVLARPGQIPALLSLGAEAAAARRALRARIDALARAPCPERA